LRPAGTNEPAIRANGSRTCFGGQTAAHSRSPAIWTNRKVEDEWVSTYAILTMDANELSAPIHDRMPLVVDPLAYDAWLWPESEPRDYSAVIRHPYGDDGFEVFPVSKAVNSPKNNSPELVNRVALSS
jgi:putative SOS response-associated peptidase YedK